jgi:hypothetical protein
VTTRLWRLLPGVGTKRKRARVANCGWALASAALPATLVFDRRVVRTLHELDVVQQQALAEPCTNSGEAPWRGRQPHGR